MEQNNNIIGYDPQTGQPIYASQNSNLQQSVQQSEQPQMQSVQEPMQQTVQSQVQNIQQPIQQVVQPQMQNVQEPMQQTVQSQNQNIQQPTQQAVQPQMQNIQQPMPQVQPSQINKGYIQTEQPQKKSNKALIIIVIIAAIVIVAGAFIFINQDKKETNNNEIPNNSENENNNISENEQNNNLTNEESTFLFRIEDVFTITGRGTVVTGKVDRGKIKVGDAVQVVGLNDQVLTTEVIGIEMFREEKTEAKDGDNVGIVLKDVSRDQIERGQVLATPDTIFSYKKFDADLTMLPLKEGSKLNWSITPEDNTAQIYFRSADVNGKFEFTDEIKSINPGDSLSITIEMERGFAMEVGSEFSIRSGGRVLGTGIVKKVY